MELMLRIVGVIIRILHMIIKPILFLIFVGFKEPRKLSSCKKNPLLNIPAVDLAEKIRNKQIKSEDVVKAYIERIKEVNPHLNAVVEDRFEQAIQEAQKADKMCAEKPLLYLVSQYPLLGVPCTIKESISVKGMSHTSGSLARAGIKASEDAKVVTKLKEAGCIILAVTSTPEFCTSWECYSHVNGRTLNPYHPGKTSGGSSGGEGALLGAGASIFGIGSDIAGSIRLPALLNGIFGHKPTTKIVSLDGHFPNSKDENFQTYLSIGPMCRYAKDLPTITYLICEESLRDQLKLDQPVYTKDIKIFYLESMGSSVSLIPTDQSIQHLIKTAVSHFKSNGLEVTKPDFGDMTETVEICSALLFDLKDVPSVLDDKEDPNKRRELSLEFFKSIVGASDITFTALYYLFLQITNGFIPESKRPIYVEKFKKLQAQIEATLGSNGVLFYPTLNQTTITHYETPLNIGNVSYCALINILGFPSTHVPAKDQNGLPIGFQVIAAPYQDRLCFTMAAELEAAFGGFNF